MSFRFKDLKIQGFKDLKIRGFEDLWVLFRIYDLGFTIWDLRFTIYDLGFTIKTWNLKPGTWNLEPGTWNLEPGTWNLEPATWNLKPATFKLIFCALCAFVVNISQAQLLTPLSNEMNCRVETELIRSGQPWFSAVKPFIESQEQKAKSQELIANNQKQKNSEDTFPSERTPSVKFAHYSWFKRKLLYESFVQVDSGDFYIFADPLFDLCVGKDNTGRSTYINTRGFRAGGKLGKSFAFGTEFYENQAIFPSYIDSQIKNNKIIPGQGRGRLTGNVWDYSIASGYLSFNPVSKLNLQLGQGKHFIGDGYRSLLVSDYSYNYPYVKSTWFSDKFMYTWLLGLTQNISIKIKDGDLEPFKRELISMHLLSINATKWLQVSVMQFNIYNNPDTMGAFKLNADVINPFIVPTGSNNNKHSIWGMNIRINPVKGFYIYNQLAVDNFFTSNKKYVAVQLGIKYYDLAGLQGLYFQAEYNRVPNGMYTSPEKPLQWINYGEPLAHPLGNNIEEGLLHISYSYKRLQLENLMIITQSISNIEAGSKTLHNESKINFYLNAKTLMHFSLGYILQKEDISASPINNNYMYFAFRTGLKNVYSY